MSTSDVTHIEIIREGEQLLSVRCNHGDRYGATEEYPAQHDGAES